MRAPSARAPAPAAAVEHARPVARAALLAIAALTGSTCGPPAGRLTLVEGVSMGTTYSVQVVGGPRALDARALRRQLDALLLSIERRMSTYDPLSELSRFNADRTCDWWPVSADTVTVIDEARRVHGLTGGAFDVTVGPLVEAWGFGPGATRARQGPERVRPGPEELALALARVGLPRLASRASPPALRKRVSDLQVDLSAIAKGFAVDELARLLDARGARDYLVELGGELRARGRNPAGEPWSVAVEQPTPGGGALPCVLRLTDGAVATSGDYRQGFEQDGVRYAHVIDPRTGEPAATGIASVTVLARTAMEADAFATALMLLPVDEGLALATREGLAARLLVRSGDGFVEHGTPRFPARVRPGGSP